MNEIIYSHGGEQVKVIPLRAVKLPSAPVECFYCHKEIDTGIETPGTLTIKKGERQVLTAPLCLDCAKILYKNSREREI